MRDDVYWHFRVNRYTYGVIIVTVLCLVLFFVGQNSLEKLKFEQRKEVQNWPSIEATIIESKPGVLSSGRRSFGGTQHIELKVRYRTQDTGLDIETRVYGHWPLQWGEIDITTFERGKKIKLRVNPENPKRASLIDLTGTI
jgi:hypothetical protein